MCIAAARIKCMAHNITFFFLILRIDSHSIIRNDIESRRKSDIKNNRPTKRAKEKYAHQSTYTSQADPTCVGNAEYVCTSFGHC